MDAKLKQDGLLQRRKDGQWSTPHMPYNDAVKAVFGSSRSSGLSILDAIPVIVDRRCTSSPECA